MTISINTINTSSVYFEQLEGSNGKAAISVQLVRADVAKNSNLPRAVVSLWSYETLIAQVSYHMDEAPKLALCASEWELSQTTLRHLRKFLGCYIEKRELLKHMRNVFYAYGQDERDGFRVKQIDATADNYSFVCRAISAEQRNNRGEA